MFRNLIITLFAALAFNAFALGEAAAAVDANRATQAELESVKGIGPGLSAKIMDARKAGDFKDWKDLVDRVGGVGPANATRFSQNGLTVAGAGFDASAATPAAPKAKSSKNVKKATKDVKTDK